MSEVPLYSPEAASSKRVRDNLLGLEDGCPENGSSQGQNLALTVLFVLNSLESWRVCASRCRGLSRSSTVADYTSLPRAPGCVRAVARTRANPVQTEIPNNTEKRCFSGCLQPALLFSKHLKVIFFSIWPDLSPNPVPCTLNSKP